MTQWTGITAVTAYSPILLSQSGYSQVTVNGLAAGLNTIGIFGTIISAQIVDRLGRRKCFMGGAFGLFVVNLIVGVPYFCVLSIGYTLLILPLQAGSVYEGARNHPDQTNTYVPAATAMLFLFNVIYAATWGTMAFLIPTEIFPSEMRAQGNGFGITGWAIGVGWTTLLNPLIFKSLQVSRAQEIPAQSRLIDTRHGSTFCSLA